jgi:hypothetical protein
MHGIIQDMSPKYIIVAHVHGGTRRSRCIFYTQYQQLEVSANETILRFGSCDWGEFGSPSEIKGKSSASGRNDNKNNHKEPKNDHAVRC